MKKLMMAVVAAIATIGAASAATSFTVNFSRPGSGNRNIYRGAVDDDYKFTGTMYMVVGTQNNLKAFSKALKEAYSKGPIGSGDLESYQEFASGYNTVQVRSFQVNNSTYFGDNGVQSFTYNGNRPDGLYFLAFAEMTDVYGAANKNDTYIMVSGVQAVEAVGTNTDFRGSATRNTDAFTFGGSSAVIPEPTSGLLMLIGMAGLALKRKRA